MEVLLGTLAAVFIVVGLIVAVLPKGKEKSSNFVEARYVKTQAGWKHVGGNYNPKPTTNHRQY